MGEFAMTKTFPHAVICNGEIIPANTPIRVVEEATEKEVEKETTEETTEEVTEKVVEENDIPTARKTRTRNKQN